MSENTTAPRAQRKVRDGLVVSDKMDKTVVVEVEDRVKHALYGKVIIARNQTYVEGMLTRYRDSLTAQIEEYVQLVQTAADVQTTRT